MGVGLVRSLQPPFFGFIGKYITSLLTLASGYSFCPPYDAYVRSFLYLLYTLIKLYYTKALSDQASSLAPDWILLLQGPRILVSLCNSTTTFHSKSGYFHHKVIKYNLILTQMAKNLPAMWETWLSSLGWENPLEKGTATHSSILAWRTPWTKEPG